jgi:hypothetical protein
LAIPQTTDTGKTSTPYRAALRHRPRWSATGRGKREVMMFAAIPAPASAASTRRSYGARQKQLAAPSAPIGGLGLQLRSARKYRRLQTILNEVRRHSDWDDWNRHATRIGRISTATLLLLRSRLRRRHLPCRLHWQLQHLAQCVQVPSAWPTVIRLPEIYAGLTDADLLSNFGDR